MIGHAGDRVVTRAGARAGDAICVTGSLGAAAGGLVALERGIDAPELIERQRRPRPRIEEGSALAPVATAMIDVSDGLAIDLSHILDASGVGCRVDLDALPIDPAVRDLDVDAIDLAITGGEDFELLFTTSNVEDAARRARFTPIGVITEGDARIGDRPLNEWTERAWDHLRTR